MVSFTFKLALLVGAATVTYAMPAEIFERDDDVLETIVFKRDSVLTPRDLELAKLNGVDIRESMLPRYWISKERGPAKSSSVQAQRYQACRRR